MALCIHFRSGKLQKSQNCCTLVHILIFDVIQNHCTSDQEDMSSNPQWDRLTRNGKPRSQVFYTGDPNVICLTWHICLSSYNTRNLVQHTYCTVRSTRLGSHPTSLISTINTPLTRYWRELCREACRDPDNLNRPASSLADRFTPD
jgi:hypothetical protein